MPCIDSPVPPCSPSGCHLNQMLNSLESGTPSAGPACIALFDPYAQTGGPGQYRSEVYRCIREAFLPLEMVAWAATSRRGAMCSYATQFFYAIRRVAAVRRWHLMILQGFFNPGSAVLACACRLWRVPYILWPHGDFVPITPGDRTAVRSSRLKRYAWWLYGRTVVRNATALIAGSQLEVSRLRAAGARVRNVHIIPAGSARQLYCEDSDNRLPDHGVYALWLGRFSREKGLDLLFDCWPSVLRSCPRARLLLVGNTSDKHVYSSLLARLAHLGLEGSVRLLDYVLDSEKCHLLRNARCLVLPSHTESLGMVVPEAIMARTPVIVSTGTPWDNLPQSVGVQLPRALDLWTAALIRYLSSPLKQSIPETDADEALKPYEVNAIRQAWRNLASTLSPSGPRPETASRPV